MVQFEIDIWDLVITNLGFDEFPWGLDCGLPRFDSHELIPTCHLFGLKELVLTPGRSNLFSLLKDLQSLGKFFVLHCRIHRLDIRDINSLKINI